MQIILDLLWIEVYDCHTTCMNITLPEIMAKKRYDSLTQVADIYYLQHHTK